EGSAYSKQAQHPKHPKQTASPACPGSPSSVAAAPPGPKHRGFAIGTYTFAAVSAEPPRGRRDPASAPSARTWPTSGLTCAVCGSAPAARCTSLILSRLLPAHPGDVPELDASAYLRLRSRAARKVSAGSMFHLSLPSSAV